MNYWGAPVPSIDRAPRRAREGQAAYAGISLHDLPDYEPMSAQQLARLDKRPRNVLETVRSDEVDAYVEIIELGRGFALVLRQKTYNYLSAQLVTGPQATREWLHRHAECMIAWYEHDVDEWRDAEQDEAAECLMNEQMIEGYQRIA